MTESLFWEIIDTAWTKNAQIEKKRAKALRNNDPELLAALNEELWGSVLNNYNKRLVLLGKPDLTAFIHILEEKLYQIDRAEIYELTGGSDDDFLYARFFMVAIGEGYYNKIDRDTSMATAGLEAEQFGFAPYEVYKYKFKTEFERNTKHCIDTKSNTDAW
jgi:Protein of unknown function (DUF4240)